MRRLTSRFKRALRRSQTGQAILLMAFGFIVLIGFVGIVTDLSLLFVRYTQLRRAVDSAAVAAAGQFSRTESDVVNKQRTTYAARQFLEFHGVEPDGVVVDTCLPGMEAWSEITDAEIEAAPEPDDPGIDPDTNPSSEMLEERRRTALNVCDGDRKLVQVKASTIVPTTFMGLFGQNAVTLTAVAVSETASLDVVIVMDVSESMMFDTTYDDYDRLLFKAGTGDDTNRRWIRYLPPRWTLVHDAYEAAYNGTPENFMTENELRRWYLENYTIGQVFNGADVDGDGYGEPNPLAGADLYIDAPIRLEPTRYIVEQPGDSPRVVDPGAADVTGVENTVGGYGSFTLHEMRKECRVRVYPGAIYQGTSNANEYPYDDGITLLSVFDQYWRLTDGDGGFLWGGGNQKDMFTANYDFYGCCNDPTFDSSLRVDGEGRVTGDIVLGNPTNLDISPSDVAPSGMFDFSDLVCQPFKQARDASLEFLYNIDFLAGDRVAFVTFDRNAYIMDPDGDGPQPPMIEDREMAVQLLTRTIGVRAEPTGYHSDGTQTVAVGGRDLNLWTDYSAGTDADGNSLELDLDANYNSEQIGLLTRNYLVKYGCEFDNAWLPYAFSLWSTQDQEYGILGTVASPPFHTNGQWENHFASEEMYDGNSEFYAFSTYERTAGCAGTNFGAALREANNALVDERTIRKDGAVWVIVLLSDGAAGRTDPIPFGTAPDPDNPPDIQTARPYAREGQAEGDPPSPYNNPAPVGAEYGAYGFCPYGESPNDPRGFVRGNFSLPSCADQDPNERHACGTDLFGDPNIKDDGEINLITQQFIDPSDPECLYEYDADDYARDWADWVALIPESEQGTSQRPTIFTIGFNLEYNRDPADVDGATNRCEANPVDCVGEELLRYIADVGDNNQQDYDYPNSSEGDRFIRVNYGNYWNAPDEEQLNEVFDEIASRLFTRLTG